jgi:hypothetical protein
VHLLICRATAGLRWLKRHGYESTIEDCHGITYTPNDSSDIYVWISHQGTLLDVSHELVHATISTLHISDVPISRANEEAIAYLHEHLLAAYLQRRAKRSKLRKRAQKPKDPTASVPDPPVEAASVA